MNTTVQHLIGAAGFDSRSSRGVALLEAIDSCGSINSAAKQLGMSYKAAWEQVDLLNNLADAPLLKRAVGGRGGGGTELTAAGRQLVRDYQRIEREYRRFIAQVSEDVSDAARLSGVLRRMEMKVSARNVWNGKIVAISDGAVNALVTLQLAGGEQLSATVTRESFEYLGLAVRGHALALVKSSAVVIACNLGTAKISTRNLLCGNILRLVDGPVSSEVTIGLSGGTTVTATVTRESAEALELQEGAQACALIKASSVLLAVV